MDGARGCVSQSPWICFNSHVELVLWPARYTYEKSVGCIWLVMKLHEARSEVGAHLSKLWPYTGNWAKSMGWAFFCETMVCWMNLKTWHIKIGGIPLSSCLATVLCSTGIYFNVLGFTKMKNPYYSSPSAVWSTNLHSFLLPWPLIKHSTETVRLLIVKSATTVLPLTLGLLFMSRICR